MACQRVSRKTISHETVDLSSRQLKAFPKKILSYKDIKYLNLGVKNVIVYSMQPSMTVVKSANKIRRLPTDIDILQNLKLLDLSFNDIKKLPKRIYNLKQLELLDLSYNKEITIDQIEALQTLPDLKKLYVIGVINTSQDSLHIRETFSKTKVHVYLSWSDLNN